MTEETPPLSPGDHLRAAARPLRSAFGLAALAILVAGYAPEIGASAGGGISFRFPSPIRFAWLPLAGLAWALGSVAECWLRAWAASLDRPREIRRGVESLLPPPAPAEPPPDPLREFREALAAGDFSLAASLAETIPGPPEAVATRLAEVASAREARAATLRAKIAAAREARDPIQVLDHREDLARLLGPAPAQPEDRALAKWLVQQVQHRLQQGIVNAETATLAARIAEGFGEFPEGASMRAALPTLRRSAKLCARCGKPYEGIEDACPECLIAPGMR